MKYIITGSTGHISKPIAQKLIAAGHLVTIITTNIEKVRVIESLGAKAEVGSVEDVAFLSGTFAGADAVYTMIPPTYSTQDWKKHIATVGANYAQAIRSVGVKHVVNLSSIGAHMPEGCGPVSGLYFAEKSLNELPDTHVLHLRPGFFYYNFLAQIGMVKQMGILGGNYGNGKIVLAHTNDIADVAADELLKLSFKEKSYLYVSSDLKTTDEVANVLGDAIGKPDLKWVDFTDEQNLGGLVQAGLSEELSRNYTEMGSAMRSGEMFADYVKQGSSPRGKIKLGNFAKEFSAAYNQ
jgi:uncharacterized protein YbjT (DUF2867 family)